MEIKIARVAIAINRPRGERNDLSVRYIEGIDGAGERRAMTSQAARKDSILKSDDILSKPRLEIREFARIEETSKRRQRRVCIIWNGTA